MGGMPVTLSYVSTYAACTGHNSAYKKNLCCGPGYHSSSLLSQRFLKDSAAHHIATRQMADILFVIVSVDVGEFCDRGMRRRRNSIGAIKNCPAFFICCLGGVRGTIHHLHTI